MALVHNGSRAVTVSGDDLAVVWDLQVRVPHVWNALHWCAVWRLLLSVGGLPLKRANMAQASNKEEPKLRCVALPC